MVACVDGVSLIDKIISYARVQRTETVWIKLHYLWYLVSVTIRSYALLHHFIVSVIFLSSKDVTIM